MLYLDVWGVVHCAANHQLMTTVILGGVIVCEQGIRQLVVVPCRRESEQHESELAEVGVDHD